MADSVSESASGWQWNIAREDLEKLHKPLILFAVGFNQFRNGEEFQPIFDDHLKLTVSKADFIGMRNSGSIARLKERLPAELHTKVQFQPCMTTVLNRYFPDAVAVSSVAENDKTIVLNLAFDRREQRFGIDEQSILENIKKALLRLVELGWKIKAAVHAWDDDSMVEFLHRNKIPAEICRLNLLSGPEIVQFYSKAPLTIGMRGHSQMIPFGCGKSIFSLISHDKMRFFLDDIGEPNWGAEISDPDLTDKIVTFVEQFPKNRLNYEKKIGLKQNEFWSITQSNMSQISDIFARSRD